MSSTVRSRDEPQEYVCVAVYSFDRITLEPCELFESASDSRAFDVSVAFVEAGNNNQQFSGSSSGAKSSQNSNTFPAPFALHTRDVLRKLLIGNRVTFVPVHGNKGHLYNCCLNDFCLDDEDLLVSAMLLKQGLVVVRRFPPAGNDKRVLRMIEIEEQAKAKGVGIHGLCRISDATRHIRPFPESHHPFHKILVQHLTHTTVKVTVERIISPSIVECVVIPSGQAIKVRLAGVLPPTEEQWFVRSRVATSRSLLHRTVTVALATFDAVTSGFWATLTSCIDTAMVEQGLSMVDYRSIALSLHSDELVAAEQKARERKNGIWSNPNMKNPTMVASFQGVGTVVAVPDEVTLQIVLSRPQISGLMMDEDFDNGIGCTTSSDNTEDVTDLCVVRLSFLGSPEPVNLLRHVPGGRILRYSSKAFFGRELLRQFCIGQLVHIQGTSAPPFPDKYSWVDGKDVATKQQPQYCVGRVVVSNSSEVDVHRILLESDDLYSIKTTNTNSSANQLIPWDICEMVLRRNNVLTKETLPEVSPQQQPETVSPSLRDMDILYVETGAQLTSMLSENRIPLSTSLECIVESISVYPTPSFHVYLCTLGISVCIVLEGVRFLSRESRKATPSLLAAEHAYWQSLTQFFRHEVLHRSGHVFILDRCATLDRAMMGTVSLIGHAQSIAREIITLGLGIASRLVSHVPFAPSVKLVEAQESARLQQLGLWSSRELVQTMQADIQKETRLENVASAQELAVGDDIVPLAWKDHQTFTYRRVADDEMYAEIKAAVAASRFLKKKDAKIRVRDIVAAPFDGMYYRAEVLTISAASSEDTQTPSPSDVTLMCNVHFLDYGVDGQGIPLNNLKCNYRGDVNVLAKWPPTARHARHAFIAFPDTGGVPVPGNTEKRKTKLPHLVRVVYDLLLEKMAALVNFPKLTMFRIYVKEGVEHVLLLPPGQLLTEASCEPFELMMWREVDALQNSFCEHRDSESLKTVSLLHLEQGCSDYSSLMFLNNAFVNAHRLE